MLLLEYSKCLVAFLREFIAAWANSEQEPILQDERRTMINNNQLYKWVHELAQGHSFFAWDDVHTMGSLSGLHTGF